MSVNIPVFKKASNDEGILEIFILSGNSSDRVMPVLSLSITCPPAFSREKQK
jgi:hypothetical protein